MGDRRHIKKGDTVYILSGNERGKSGKVIDVLTASERVVVEGLNMLKKHIRKNQDQPQGEIAEREGTIHWSNVCLLYTSPSPRDRSLSRMPSSA